MPGRPTPREQDAAVGAAGDEPVAKRHAHAHHAVSAGADSRYLAIALGLIAAFMVGEVVAAAVAGSLALLADAGHMLADVAALGGSLWAARLAARPAGGIWTFGLKRAEILSATGNGVTLAVVAAAIVVEAGRRLVAPSPVEGGVVVVVALAGVAVNGAAAAVLARANRSSLNVAGVVAHVATDLFAFVGTAVAGAVILLTGWQRADAVASLLVAALMARAAVGLLREGGRILLQAAPANVELAEVRRHLAAVDHVLGVHDLHIWAVTSELPTVSAHVVVEDHCFASGHAPQILDTLQRCLGDHFDVEHSTFQLEPPSHVAHEHEQHP